MESSAPAVAPTSPGQAPLTPRDPRLAPWRAFVRAHAEVSRRLDDDLRAEHGLSLQEYVTLLILVEAPERRLRMGRVAEALTLSKSGATRLIDRLVDDGLVERASCSSDARGAEARLTEAGVQRLRTAAPTHLRGIAEYFLATIDQADLPAIERVMTDVARCAGDAPGAHHGAPIGSGVARGRVSRAASTGRARA
ncbi:MAG: MarR family transcriptional regulator [Chloroflexi bacterium]|nr:MarR family transcriptional regulator [Chloroflexota bacterium]